MYNTNKINSPLNSSFEQPVYQNQKQIRNVQSKYFIDEYQKSLQMKKQKMEEEKQKKKAELEIYNRKNQQYLNNVTNSRLSRLHEQQLMAEQYNQMINQRKSKEQQQKKNDKIYERQILGQKSWIRDADQQRSINKYKVNRYNEELENHVKAREERIKREQDIEYNVKNKINEQAEEILKKQMQRMSDRQRKKDTFEQRQNDLLGANSLNSSQVYKQNNQPDNVLGKNNQSNSKIIEQINMRKRQQELYGAGLQIQRQAEEQRKRKQWQQGYTAGEVYNPITNPIPVVYKNPNVLRMLSQK